MHQTHLLSHGISKSAFDSKRFHTTHFSLKKQKKISNGGVGIEGDVGNEGRDSHETTIRLCARWIRLLAVGPMDANAGPIPGRFPCSWVPVSVSTHNCGITRRRRILNHSGAYSYAEKKHVMMVHVSIFLTRLLVRGGLRTASWILRQNIL